MTHLITVETLPTKSGLICLKQTKRKTLNGDELVFESQEGQQKAIVSDVHENEKALRQEWRVVSYDLVPTGVPTLDRHANAPRPEETPNDNL